MKLACLFVTWNSAELIDDSIGRLIRLFPEKDVWVVDNGSCDGTGSCIAQRFPGVRLHLLPANLGFSGGNNYGVRLIMREDYEAVCLLNADTIIEENFLGACLAILGENTSVGIVGPTVLEATSHNVIQCEGARLRDWTLNFDYFRRGEKYVRERGYVEVGYVLGAAMMIRREVIERIGCFDEDYNPAYVEEADFCYRARRAGFRSVVDRGSAIIHIGEQSSGGRAKAFDRLSVRRFYFGVKHLGPATFVFASALVVARVFYWKCRARLTGH